MANKKYALVGYIGRFAPFHNGHLALLRQALSLGDRVVVILGSSFGARTIKDPFTWEERASMIKLALSQAEAERVSFLPVRDYYVDDRWLKAVNEGVSALVEPGGNIALLGHFKDSSSYYLNRFPNWALESVERQGNIDATPLRNALLGMGYDVHRGPVISALAKVLPNRLVSRLQQWFGPSPVLAKESVFSLLTLSMPAPVVSFIRAWAEQPHLANLQQEYRLIQGYRDAWKAAPYAPTFVTADSVVTCADHVLLVRRGRFPGKGLLALPGGFVDQDEPVYRAAVRELNEETSLNKLPDTMALALKDVRVFDYPRRSQRGRTITHAHLFRLLQSKLPEVRAALGEVQEVLWFPIAGLIHLEDQMMEDHFHILDSFLNLTAE